MRRQRSTCAQHLMRYQTHYIVSSAVKYVSGVYVALIKVADLPFPHLLCGAAGDHSTPEASQSTYLKHFQPPKENLSCSSTAESVLQPAITAMTSRASCTCHQQASSCHFLPLPMVVHRGQHAVCRLTAVDKQSSYPYNSGDDRKQKATIEHIFSLDAAAAPASSSTDRVQAPWAVGWQVNERNIMWNDDLKLRLIKRVASQELHISEEVLEEHLQQLTNLLPDLATRLVNFPPQRIAQLAASIEMVAVRLLRLRQIFPQASASAMVGNRLTLLLDDDLDRVQSAAQRLRQLLPQLNIDKFVEAFPMVLDVDDFERALQDAKRIMPNIDVPNMLRTNPDMILSLQKGKNLIPYDQIENPWS